MPHRFHYTTPSGARIVERQPSRMYRLELLSTDAVLRNASVIAFREHNIEARKLIQQARKILSSASRLNIKGADPQIVHDATATTNELLDLLVQARNVGASPRHMDSAVHSVFTSKRAIIDEMRLRPEVFTFDMDDIERELT